MPEVNADFPYFQSNRSIFDFTAALRRAMPSGGIVTPEYIVAASGVTLATAKNTLSDLKKFGLIGEDGVLSETGRMLRSQDLYRDLGNRLIDQYFSELRTFVEVSPDDWQGRIERFLVEKTALGDSARRKLRGTLAVLVGMSRGTDLSAGAEKGSSQKPKPAKVSRPVSSSPERSPAEANLKQEARVAGVDSNIHSHTLNSTLVGAELISSVLRINIDGTWDTERINLVFDRLEGLLSVGPVTPASEDSGHNE